MTQHHPSSEDVSKVAETFERLAAKHPTGLVDLDSVDITRRGDDEHCVACTGGWFLMGTFDDPETDITWDSVSYPKTDPIFSDVHGVARHATTGEMARFEDGAIRLSIALNFGSIHDVGINIHAIEDYYGNRPWLWGCNGLFGIHDASTGSLMFCDARAYGGQMGDTLPLNNLAKHWRGVETRTRQIEEEMQRSGRDFDEVERGFLQISETKAA